MTSIHNNAGAMVALSTLNKINNELLDTQESIATGKNVNSSADNAAIWAVTTIMEADVAGFGAISESLNLGKATVTVARNAAEKTTELLQEMKEKIVTAQQENVDRSKIQTDIDELKNQIESIVNSAQFNGLNLIDGSVAGDIKVISSIDRSSSGVNASSISVTAQNLSTGNATAGTGAEITTVTAQTSTTNAIATGNTSQTIALTETGSNALASEAEFELYIEGVSVGSTVSVAAGSSSEDTRLQVVQYIENLGRDDIKATVSATGVDIESLVAFDDIDVELRILQDGGLDTTTNANTTLTLIPGISSVSTSRTDTQTVATIQVADATAAAVFDFEIDGTNVASNFTTTGTANTDAATLEAALTAGIATAGLSSDLQVSVTTDTVTITSSTGKNFDFDAIVDATSASAGQLDIALSNDAGTGVGTASSLSGLATNTGARVSGTLEGVGADIDLDSTLTLAENDAFTVYLREGLSGQVTEFTYVAGATDTKEDVANGLKELIDADGDYDVHTEVIESSGGDWRLRVDALGSETVYVAVDGYKNGSGSGGLGKLAGLDVTSTTSAAQALEDIEDLIQTSIDAASSFGSSEKRLEIQSDFVSSLIDSMKSGIGALVDTNMEAASARLQALQVQQQLGTQALSIANSAPQNILSLFR